MMKFRLLVLPVTVLVPAVLGATTPAYTNKVTLQSPPDIAPNIDATLFVNEAYFEVNDFNFTQPLPFETLNTLHFINDVGGTMAGTPGYRWDYFRTQNNSRSMMSSWVNRNIITTESTNQFFFFTTPAQWLLVSATNIRNAGLMNASPQSLIRLNGKSVNMDRGRVRTGPSTNRVIFSGGGNLLSTNYFNDLGVTDLYWGTGSNNVVSGTGNPMLVDSSSFTPSFVPPFFQSASHQVIQSFGSFLFTNFNILSIFDSSALVVAHTNRIGSDSIVQVVFVNTNSFDTNLSVDVRFLNFGGAGGGRTAVVAFNARERDVVYDRDVTNAVYLLDALAFQTNVALARNTAGTTRKPETYEVTKGLSPFILTNDFLYQRPNLVFTNKADYGTNLLYKPTYASNAVPVTYAAYAAQVSALSVTDPAVAGTAFSDPTNFPGRIEILANTLNLREARIRADSTLIITANNLTNNSLLKINAPFINFDVGTTQPALVISNLAPATVSRISGGIFAWSATWDNVETLPTGTNNVRFHVLFVDHTLSSSLPVSLNKFHARGTDIVICDPLNVGQSLRLEAQGVHVKAGAALNFPPNSDWTALSVVNVNNFTNDGFVNIPGAALVGSDRGFSYANFINRGTNTAGAWSILAETFDNPGCIAAQASGFTLNANRATLHGRAPVLGSVLFTNFFTVPPTVVTQAVTNVAAKITAITDVNITASVVTLSNANLFAGIAGSPGAVILSASARLSDSGPQATNHLITTGGLRVPRRPTGFSDLMGTYAVVRVPAFSEAQNVWDGKNLGAVTLGYSNNLALGKLTLDGGESSIIRFAGLPTKDNAIYVDYLELLNNATNFTNPDVLAFESNIRIYFAHANVAASKLDKAQNRFFWVKGFMGPLSTTNIVYPSGNIYPVNISLAQHKDFDSDGDGIPNINDPTPVYTAESIGLTIAHDAQPGRVLLSWQAVANATSHVEYKPVIVSTGPWQLLRSTSAPVTMRMNMTDTTTGRTQRIYRVRVDLPPQ